MRLYSDGAGSMPVGRGKPCIGWTPMPVRDFLIYQNR